MPSELKAALALVRDITLAGGLVFILWGGYRKWWVWGYQLSDAREDAAAERKRADEREKELKAEIKEWKETTMRNIDLVRQTVAFSRETRERAQP